MVAVDGRCGRRGALPKAPGSTGELATVMNSLSIPQPFHLPRFGDGALGRLFARLAEAALAFPRLNRVYAGVRRRDGANFAERALAELGVQYHVDPRDLAGVPRKGPLLVVANHPFGGLDGIVLAAVLARVRPDVRFLANFLLGCMEEWRDMSFLVDPFGGPAAARRNLAAMRAAVRWVRDGGALAVFPSGEVSHRTWRDREITDPPWSRTVGRLVQRARPAVLPVFFEGRNSRHFQWLGMIHPRLRTALLPRELLNKRRTTVTLHVGSPISPARLAGFDDAGELTTYLRLRTYILRGRSAVARGTTAPMPAGPRETDEPRPSGSGLERRDDSLARHLAAPREPIVAPLPAETVAAEIAVLPPDQRLISAGPLEVWFARAARIPSVMREIGRLREATFRLVGEGTGRSIDLDRFDPYYLHLFLWDAEQRRVAGAYRMGPTDEIVPRLGVAGLYTQTLFDIRPALLDQIGPALEMGRSFICPDYQKSYSPLLLLWKGIGRFVAREPRYRRLFGPVSISNEYHSMTRQLLMTFLRAHNMSDGLAELVHPRNPPHYPRFPDFSDAALSTAVRGMDEVDELVREIECDRRATPVLLRQYLRLSGVLLGFNIDPDFGDVLDGLVLVDLAGVDRAILDRHMGRDGAERFLAFHART